MAPQFAVNQNLLWLLALAILCGYLLMIHHLRDSSAFDRASATNTILINADHSFQQNNLISVIQSHQPAPLESASLSARYLSQSIHGRRYEVDDFSFFWESGDGSPLFLNASKYDADGRIGFDSFVFCPMPKNGCSAWKQVLRRMKGEALYLADDFWSLHSQHNQLEADRIHRFGVDAANEIMRDPNIKHAVFIRDAIERSLSAFLDKCVGSHWSSKYWCTPRTNRSNDVTTKASFCIVANLKFIQLDLDHVHLAAHRFTLILTSLSMPSSMSRLAPPLTSTGCRRTSCVICISS